MPKRANCVAQFQDGTVAVIQALAVFSAGSTREARPPLLRVEKLQRVRNTPFRAAQLGVLFSSILEVTRSAEITVCDP